MEELRLEIMDAVNALGIGAQGLGLTVLDVKILDYPTHMASLRCHDSELPCHAPRTLCSMARARLCKRPRI